MSVSMYVCMYVSMYLFTYLFIYKLLGDAYLCKDYVFSCNVCNDIFYCVTNSTCEYRMPFKEISKHKGRDSVGEENAPADMCTKNIFK